jgi:hypothetical protein
MEYFIQKKIPKIPMNRNFFSPFSLFFAEKKTKCFVYLLNNLGPEPCTNLS